MQQDEYFSESIELPKPLIDLNEVFRQLKLFSKERLDTSDQNIEGMSAAQIKGLKFISSKLAKLFFKNRQLPYNEISKILIDNFASEQKDQRNIKRRVYDAINVLVAAGILIKKNNTIEMIKNKIKIKTQAGKKERIEDEIKEKEETINHKLEKQKYLTRKHKLIKKFFERNAKQQNNFKIQSEVNASDLKKSKTRKRTLEQAQNNSLRALSIQNNWMKNVIYRPTVFIVNNENFSAKNGEGSVLGSFDNENQIAIMVTSQKKSIQRKGFQFYRQKSQQNQMEDQNVKIESNECQIESDDVFAKRFGIFSLIDLLELLSLQNQDQ